MAFDQSTARPANAVAAQNTDSLPKGFDKSTAKKAEKRAAPNTSGFQDFKRGMANSVLKTGFGAYDLFGGEISEVQKQALSSIDADVKAGSGWGAAGSVLGEVAQLALPAGAVAKGLKAASKLRSLPNALGGAKALLAGDALLTGGYEAIKKPDEGDTRLNNFGGGVVDGLVGGVGGAILRKSVQGINKNKVAEELMAEGVRLTPAQAAQSVLPRGIEYAMNVLPTTSKGVQKARDASMSTWNTALANKINPIPEQKITEVGVNALAAVKDNFNAVYESAWSQARRPSNEALLDMIDSTANIGVDLDEASQAALKTVLKDVKLLSSSNNPTAIAKQLDGTLKRYLDSANMNGNIPLADALFSLRSKVRAGTGTKTALDAIDGQYGNWKAASGGADNVKSLVAGGNMTPTNLMGGVRKSQGTTNAVTGKSPLYDFAKDSAATLEYADPNPIVDFMRGYAVHAPTLLPVETMGDVLIGRSAPQKLIQKGYNSPLAETLRTYGGRGSVVLGQLDNEL